MKQVIGILLILVGVAYFSFQGFRYTSQEKVLDIGPLHATANTQKELVPYSPLLGGAIVAGGTLLFLAGLARRER
jgi:drug/metabolite transporter (DMT)-like permease